MARYVALLRGINVGGKNPVPMADLRATFESVGHTAVRTYIQSGNVLFESLAKKSTLESALERAIEDRFGAPLMVVVRSHRELTGVVERAPKDFGAHPDRFHSDAVFLKPPLTAAKAMRVVEQRDGVDRAWPGRGVIYFERLSAERTKSRMGRMVGTDEYQLMTIRSWQTTVRLLAMLGER